MKRTAPWLLTVCRLAALVGLAVSAAMLVDYLASEPSFCSAGGCDAVKKSAFGRLVIGGVSIQTPLFGVVGFSSVLALAGLPTLRRRVLPFLAAPAGAAGLAFLLIQAFAIGAFCPWCVAADSAGLVVAAAGIGYGFVEENAEETHFLWVWPTLGVLAVVVPLGWPSVRPMDVPAAVRELWVDGKLNVIELADFECPFCRRFHGVLEQALHDVPADKLNLRRIHKPLAMHPNAPLLAKMYFCGEAQQAGERTAKLLVEWEAETAAARPEGVATELKLDVPRFVACLTAKETQAKLDANLALAERIPFRGLPTTWIGSRKVEGARPFEQVRPLVEAELAGRQRPSIPAWAWFGGAGLLVVAGLWFGRPRTVAPATTA